MNEETDIETLIDAKAYLERLTDLRGWEEAGLLRARSPERGERITQDYVLRQKGEDPMRASFSLDVRGGALESIGVYVTCVDAAGDDVGRRHEVRSATIDPADPDRGTPAGDLLRGPLARAAVPKV